MGSRLEPDAELVGGLEKILEWIEHCIDKQIPTDEELPSHVGIKGDAKQALRTYLRCVEDLNAAQERLDFCVESNNGNSYPERRQAYAELKVRSLTQQLENKIVYVRYMMEKYGEYIDV